MPITPRIKEILGRDGGGSGCIIGRSTFERPEALAMLACVIEIFLGKG